MRSLFAIILSDARDHQSITAGLQQDTQRSKASSSIGSDQRMLWTLLFHIARNDMQFQKSRSSRSEPFRAPIPAQLRRTKLLEQAGVVFERHSRHQLQTCKNDESACWFKGRLRFRKSFKSHLCMSCLLPCTKFTEEPHLPSPTPPCTQRILFATRQAMGS